MNRTVEWCISPAPVPYPDALAAMEARVEAIARGDAGELVWLLEHPPVYTAGTSAKAADLLTPDTFPVYKTGRGGEYTYHGPGQRVAYVLLDLKRRAQPDVPDVRAFVQALERWLIATLAEFGVDGSIREGRVGVWVNTPRGEEKIAALGLRIRKGVSYHGVALNVNPNLSHFAGIVPCGLKRFGITSLAALGNPAIMEAVDAALKRHFSPCVVAGFPVTHAVRQ